MAEGKFSVGACGKACFVCMRYSDKTCLGCPVELEKLPVIDCIFYDCAKTENISNCLQCTEYPCKQHRGISGLFCPIYRQKKWS
ncbi:MAG: DUF3795 domain-containing protein [Methanocellales archaeon]|nr:DUF3795 domain-containing protein [Methanocellales archaeon]